MKKISHFFLFYFYILKNINNQKIKSYDTSFKNEEKINIISGTINSFKTRIPYDLYYLDLCTPDDPILFPSNLGEIILSGNSYETNYQLSINNSSKCNFLCSEKIKKRDFNKINDLIKKEYFINYYLDNLPVGLMKTYVNKNNKIKRQIRFDRGIPLGYIENNITYIYNYYKIYIELKKEIVYDNYNVSNIEYNIIGFYIEPFSLNINDINKCFNKNNYTFEKQILKPNEYINFYYDQIYIYTDLVYDDRIKKYYITNNSIHWNSIIISCLIISFLTIILIFIFFNSIKSEKDVKNNRIISDEEINEYGWRNVAFDVFRCPENIELLSSILGTGIQLFVMAFYSLFFIRIGLLRPRNGGSYLTIMVMMYVFLGIISGYSTSRFYKMLNGKNWINLTMISILFFPLIFIFIFSIINLIYKKEKSSIYMEFDEFFSSLILWVFWVAPLIFLGILFGFFQKKILLPCKINPVPSLISGKTIPWYLKIRYAWIFTGFPPFFGIFVELFYIMDSLWKQNIYALNIYLLSSLIVLIIISSEIAILFTFFNLCKGDYRWWWKSLLVGSSPGLYLLLFSLLYSFKMDFISTNSFIIYLCFMSLLTIIVIIICGAFGLFFTFIFIRIIYSKININ